MMRAFILALLLGWSASAPAVSISVGGGLATLEAEDGSQSTWRGAVMLRGPGGNMSVWNLRSDGMGDTRARKLAHLRYAVFQSLVAWGIYQNRAQDRTAYAAEFDVFSDAVILAAEAR